MTCAVEEALRDGRQRTGTAAALLGASCLTAMAATAITPALTGLADAFADVPHIELLAKIAMTLPALVIAVSAAGLGVLVDRLGARPVLVASALLFALAGSAGLYVGRLDLLLASRALLGVAIAGLSTGTLALIGTLYQGADRRGIIGYQGAAMSFGGMAFLILGGLLASYGWRWSFASYLLALAVLPLLLRNLPRTIPVRAAASEPDTGETSWRRLAFAYVAAFLGMILFYVIPVHLPFHLAEHGVAEPALAAYALALATLTGGATSFLYKQVSERLAPVTTVTLVFLLIAGGEALIAEGFYPRMLAGVAVAGIAAGLLLPTVGGLVLAAAAARHHGRFTGGLASCLFLGQFVAPFGVEMVKFLVGDVFAGTAVIAVALAAAMTACRFLPMSGRLS